MKIQCVRPEQCSKLQDIFNSGDVVEVLGIPVQMYGIRVRPTWQGWFDIEIDAQAIFEVKPPAPETEEEKTLKHVNKLHQQDIEHKKRMIANNDAKLEELRKKRESV